MQEHAKSNSARREGEVLHPSLIGVSRRGAAKKNGEFAFNDFRSRVASDFDRTRGVIHADRADLKLTRASSRWTRARAKSYYKIGSGVGCIPAIEQHTQLNTRETRTAIIHNCRTHRLCLVFSQLRLAPRLPCDFRASSVVAHSAR